MGTSGFPILAERTGVAFQGGLLFKDFEGTYSGVITAAGLAEFTVADNFDVAVGDTIFVNGPNYPFKYGKVLGVTGTTIITTDIVFTADDTGIWESSSNVLWTEDTPPNTLKEIHLQILTSESVVISVTLDGRDFFPLNNNGQLFGLSTITMFVGANTELNFVVSSATTGGFFMDLVVAAA